MSKIALIILLVVAVAIGGYYIINFINRNASISTIIDNVNSSKPLSVSEIDKYIDYSAKKSADGCTCSSTKMDGSTCSWVNKSIVFEGYATEMGPDFTLTDVPYLYINNQGVSPTLSAQHYGKFKVSKTTKVQLKGKIGFDCYWIMGKTPMSPVFQVEEMKEL